MTTTAPSKKRSRRSVPAAEKSAPGKGAVDAIAPASSILRDVPLDQIDAHPANPRKDLGDLTELTASIKEQGVLEPVILVPAPGTGKFSRYRTIAGHRRCAAARAAGIDTVPCIIRDDMTDAEQLEVMVVENGHRSDLNVIEQGQAFQGLLDLGAKRTAIAKRTGYTPKIVSQRVKVAALPERITDRVIDHQLTFAEALDFADLQTSAPDLYSKVANAPAATAQAVRDALANAERAARAAQAIEQWKTKGHELRLVAGYSTTFDAPEEGALSVAHDLQMQADEHAHCPGAVLVALRDDPDSASLYGRFWCVKPEEHTDRLAQIAKERQEQADAPVELTPEEEEQQAATAEWQAAADARWLWVTQLLASSDPEQQRARDVLIDRAVTTVKGADGRDRLDYLGKPADAGEWPTDPAAALALAVVYDLDARVPSYQFNATRMVEQAAEPWMARTVSSVRAYLTVLSIAGYELSAREQELLDALTTEDGDE